VNDAKVLRFVTPPELAGQRIDRALAVLVSGLTRTEAQRAIAGGSVVVNGSPVVRPSERVEDGDEICLRRAAPIGLALEPEPIPLDVRFEDEQLVVLVKPAGLVMHPGAGVRRGTLVGGLLARYGALPGDPLRPGLVHRLDRETSGLLVVALTPEAHQGLAAQVAARSMRRRYEAIVWGEPQAEGVIEAPIARSRRDRTRMAIARIGGRAAATEFRAVERFGIATRLEVDLRTGRTHQIRVHFEHLGYPVAGDPVYSGRPRSLLRFPLAERDRVRRFLAVLRRQALHAFELGFVHPVSGAALRFQAERPADLEAALAILRGAPPGPDPAPDSTSDSARASAFGQRLLGIDLGTRRVGVAISDQDGRIATPLAQLEPRNDADLVDQVADLAENEGVGGVVVGDPRHPSGDQSEGSRAAARLAESLGSRLRRPVWLWDERLTTFAAEAALREAAPARPRRRSGRTSTRARAAQRSRVNQLAATLILQDFLDTHRGKALPPPAAGPEGTGGEPDAQERSER
jgi:23S rRNA pseudouridine1911/1915/1917 synthase